ncbi:MAG: hypothetical protein ABGY41_06290 [Candidatus Poribacteria bacterium]
MASLAAAVVYHEGGHGILDDHDHGPDHKHGDDAGNGRGPKLVAAAVVAVAVVAFVVLRVL